MNIQQSLDMSKISVLKQLAPKHPVFLLDMGNGKCVIKQDNINSNTQAMNPASIMNAIDPSAHSRVLDKRELMGLRTWASSNQHLMDVEDHGYFMQIVGDALRPPTRPTFQRPVPGQRLPMNPGVSQQKGAWTVMQAKENLMDLESAAEKRIGGNKANVKAITEKLRAPGGLEKIGEIIAVDAFNNYGDRVNFDLDGGKRVDGMTERCKCMWNPGNFFVDGNEGVLGLDAIDPNTEFNNWEKMPEIPTGSQYAGRVLRRENGQMRRNIGTLVVHDFELLLGPRNRKGIYKIGGATHRLPKDGVMRLVRGMESGGQKILAHLKTRYMNGGVPHGLQRRLNEVGWLNRSNFPRL